MAEVVRRDSRHHQTMLAFRPRTRLPSAPDEHGWATPKQAWAISLTEQAMVLDPQRWSLVGYVGNLAQQLPPSLRRAVTATPDGTALELRTGGHATVGGAIAELGALRGRLSAAVGRAGMRAAAAGAHPEHAPTFALHVGVTIPAAGQAALAHDRLRGHLPLLLALSANSPFLEARETGLASARGEALEDPTADIALRADRSLLELRVMDAQTRLCDAAALAALVQSLVRLEATRPIRRTDRRATLETVVNSRTRAATLGMHAMLHDTQRATDRPARELASEVVDACVEHAAALGCLAELERVRRLAAHPGDVQQRARARLRSGEPAGGRRLRALTGELSAAYMDA
jgi:glutamate---cysteine ligase / carboxylate-amine ligase